MSGTEVDVSVVCEGELGEAVVLGTAVVCCSKDWNVKRVTLKVCRMLFAVAKSKEKGIEVRTSNSISNTVDSNRLACDSTCLIVRKVSWDTSSCKTWARVSEILSCTSCVNSSKEDPLISTFTISEKMGGELLGCGVWSTAVVITSAVVLISPFVSMSMVVPVGEEAIKGDV